MAPRLCIIPARALQDDAMTFREMRALLAIGRFSDAAGGNVWASNETLAEAAKLDERDFRRAVKALVDRGYIRKTERVRANGGTDTAMLEVVLDGPIEEASAKGGGANHPTGGEGRITPPAEGRNAPGEEGRSTPPNDSSERPQELLLTPRATTSVGLTERFEAEEHRTAYLHFRGEARNAASFDATVGSVNRPVTGGAAYAWEIIGAALLDMAGNGSMFNANLLRACCRKLVSADASPGLRPGARLLAPNAALFWERCKRAGIVAASKRDEIDAGIDSLVAAGDVTDRAEFLELVMHVKPWEFADARKPEYAAQKVTERMQTFRMAVAS